VLAAMLSLVVAGGIAGALWALDFYHVFPNTGVMVFVFCVGATVGVALLVGSMCCFAISCRCCGRDSSREDDNENINLL
jgi:hypothetical protein